MTEQLTIRGTERGKFALQHSTVTALIVGGFIVGSEVLESLIPASGTVLSLFVAIAILVMLRPIQRLALRMADRLMHSVQSAPAHLEIPRLEVYRSALEEVIQDGIVTDKERRILGRLLDDLGVSPHYSGFAGTTAGSRRWLTGTKSN